MKKPVDPLNIRAGKGALATDGPVSPLITLDGLANYLSVSRKTAMRLVRSGQVPSIMIGDTYRFDVLAVRRAMAQPAAGDGLSGGGTVAAPSSSRGGAAGRKRRRRQGPR